MELPNRLLSSAEAAKFLGVSPSTLSKMRVVGDGPLFAKQGRRRVVYDPADLTAWTEANKRRSTSDRGGMGGR